VRARVRPPRVQRVAAAEAVSVVAPDQSCVAGVVVVDARLQRLQVGRAAEPPEARFYECRGAERLADLGVRAEDDGRSSCRHFVYVFAPLPSVVPRADEATAGWRPVQEFTGRRSANFDSYRDLCSDALRTPCFEPPRAAPLVFFRPRSAC